MNRKGMLSAALTAMALSAAVPANAAQIIGDLGISGSVTYNILSGGNSGLAIIDFGPQTGTGPGTNGTGTSQVILSSGTGYFATLVSGTATILDLTNDPAAAGTPPDGPLYAPPGGAVAPVFNNFLRDFNTAAPFPGLVFDLTQVVAQSGPACTGTEGIGDSCVEGPFALQDTNGGLRVNFDVLGWFRNGADEGFFSGSFSSTFGGLHFQDVDMTNGSLGLFSRLIAGGPDIFCGPTNNPVPPANNTVRCTFDANFTNASVPEPATMLTFGLGSLLVGARARRRAKKEQQ